MPDAVDAVWSDLVALRADDVDLDAALAPRALDVLNRIWTTGHAEGPQPAAHGEMPRLSIALLVGAVAAVKPRKTLEIGFAKGTSGVAILGACGRDTLLQHTAMDPVQTQAYAQNGLKNVEFIGDLDRLRFYENVSSLVLPFLMQSEHGQFDFILIDASHRFDDTILEWFYADKLIKNHGFILFDDANAPAVRAAINFIEKNLPYRVHYFNDYFCIAQKMNHDQRQWFEFNAFDVPDGEAFMARARARIKARAEGRAFDEAAFDEAAADGATS